MSRDDKIEITQQHLDHATAIVEWLRTLPVEGEDNYLANLAALASVGRVTFDMANLAASAPRAFARSARDTLIKDLQRNVYAGNVGESIDTLGTVVRAEHKSGVYGAYVLVNIIADNGAMITSFATGKDAVALADNPFVVGERRRVFAKVKKCETYQGLASTVVTHLVVQPESFVIPAKAPRKTRAKVHG